MTFLDETLDFFKQYDISENDIAYCQIFDNEGNAVYVAFNSFKNIIKRIVEEPGQFFINPDTRIVLKNGDFLERDSYIVEVAGVNKIVRHWKYVRIPSLNVSTSPISVSKVMKGVNFNAA